MSDAGYTDAEREEMRKQAELQQQLSTIWPLVNPVKYESEEQLYGFVKGVFETYWDPLDPRYHEVVTSATLLSHRIQQFNSVPYLWFHGPPHSGKTRALEIALALCDHPLLVSSVTSGGVYQSINHLHPTLLIDETDDWGKKEKSENVQELMKILNTGYKRNGYVLRGSREGKIPVLYSTFGLKWIAGTETLPTTLNDRCIRMDCEKNARRVTVEFPASATQIQMLRGQLEMYQVVYRLGRAADTLRAREVDVDPEDLVEMIGDNRTTELFYPLYAVNPTIEGRKTLLELAKEIVESRNEEEGTGELSEVLSAVLDSWNRLQQPAILPVKEVLAEYLNYNEVEAKDKASWLGWRLRRLQFKPCRTTTGTRGIRVSPVQLSIKARRYLPARALEVSKPSRVSNEQGVTSRGLDTLDTLYASREQGS